VKEKQMAKAKFDIRTEAARPLYVGVGVTDLAVGLVRDYVADVQKLFAGVQKDVQARFTDFEFEPKALREQAVTVVNARVDALSKDAKARRSAIEARVGELQAALNENIASVGGTYAGLAERGETLVGRIRNQESTKAAATSARTTTAKAKTTRTQATKATKTTAKKTAKKASTTAKKSSTAPKSSAKATATAARKTAENAAAATTDAAEKVGD
jgi:septal ring factor EnvC (AmiA/AmiB activator)